MSFYEKQEERFMKSKKIRLNKKFLQAIYLLATKVGNLVKCKKIVSIRNTKKN